jgi:putative hydrolase of the HAD superfamily
MVGRGEVDLTHTHRAKTAVLFDLDDTLYCEHDYVRSGFQAVAEYVVGNYIAFDAPMLYRFMLKDWELNGRGKIFNNLLESFAIDLDPIRLVEIYRTHIPELTLYPDAERVVKLLEEWDIPRGIITDGDYGVQRRKLEALGLVSRFSCVILTDELGKQCWKPSPVPFRHAQELLGSVADSFIYVGDNPHKDFVTAKRMGYHTIRVIRETGDHMATRLTPEYEAEQVVSSLDEIVALLT